MLFYWSKRFPMMTRVMTRMTSLNKKAWVSKRSSQCLIKWSDALCLTMIAKICCPQSRKRLRTFNWRIESSLQSKHILAKACNIFLVHSLSKNTYVSKYLFTLLFSLLFTILVKNSIKNLCWSKLCPKLNFRQNLYKADISIKRTIFFAPMVSALEGFHCTAKCSSVTLDVRHCSFYLTPQQFQLV